MPDLPPAASIGLDGLDADPIFVTVAKDPRLDAKRRGLDSEGLPFFHAPDTTRMLVNENLPTCEVGILKATIMLKTDAQTGPCRFLRPSLPSRSLSVLLVEDEATAAATVCAAVGKLGHRLCGTASSETEAMAMVRQERPDVALIDVRLGGGDGIAVARRLRNDSGIRSIFLSGYADHGVMERITETYPLGVVHKPFSAAQLKIVLDLAARRLR